MFLLLCMSFKITMLSKRLIVSWALANPAAFDTISSLSKTAAACLIGGVVLSTKNVQTAVQRSKLLYFFRLHSSPQQFWQNMRG